MDALFSDMGVGGICTRYEKYKEDALLQKSYTVDFLTKKKKVNEGEVPQYYVENSHPAIIEPETFDLVQLEMKKRKEAKGYKTGGNCFSGKNSMWGIIQNSTHL
ncbi:recombinase family protein [Proteiniborus sp.]|uniref:recombinase family protein n=1 Tax=Proteiniborus sp. TaxID=2079015 RepID=UPI00332CE508